MSRVTARASELSGGRYSYKLGSGSRTPEQQAKLVAGGFSWTQNSKHLSGRGRDVNAYEGDSYLTNGDHEAYKFLGQAYDELAPSLPARVKWGVVRNGSQVDPGHFELDDDGDAPPALALKLDGVLEPALNLDGIVERPDDEEVVSTEATVEGATGKALALTDPRRRQGVDASTVQLQSPSSYLKAPSPNPRPNVQTMEGRAERDARATLERRPGARIEVVLPVADIASADAPQLVRDAYRRAAVSRGVPAEFFDAWAESQSGGFMLHDGRGAELTAADAYYDAAKGVRLSLDVERISRVVDDYRASRGTLKRFGDWATSDETSAGEKFVDAAGTALKPVGVAADYIGRVPRAWSTAFWSGYNSGSPSQTARAVADVYRGEDSGDVAKNPLAEGVRGSQTLARVNPRLPAMLGGITEAVADPANLVPLAAVGRLGKVGSLLRGAEEVGVFDEALSKAKPLGLTLEEVAAKVSSSAPDDLLRSAGYTVERVAAPNRATGGAASKVLKVTAPDGRVNIARDESELADFAEGFAQSARETVSKPSDVAGLNEARARYEYHAEQAANAPNKLARENAQALADDYAKEIARLEGGTKPEPDGFDIPDAPHPRASGALPHRPESPDAATRPLWRRGLGTARDMAQLPKVKAGFDLSATGRQGFAQAAAHPSYLKQAFARQVRAFASEDAANEFAQAIRNRPDFELMNDSGLFLSSTGPEAEEAFASKLARRIPGVRASDRAYSAALDSIRTQAWDNYVSSLPSHLKDNPRTLKAVADLINISTGRGVVPVLDRFAFGKKVVGALNVPFFSPRNTASKFNLISPTRLVRNMASAETRPVAYLQLRDASRGLASLGTTLGLLHLAGLDVGLDPRSSDFGKVRVGKAVYDLTGGEGYTVRYLARMARTAGRMAQGRNVKPHETPTALTRRYLRTQLQPLAAGVVDVAQGEDVQGRKVTLGSAALDLFVPFVVGDVLRGFQAEGLLGAAKAAPAGVLGVGVNFYDKPKEGKGARSSPAEVQSNQLNLEGERESSNVEDLRDPDTVSGARYTAEDHRALVDERREQGEPEIDEAKAGAVALMLDSMPERDFGSYAKSLDEAYQLGRVGEGTAAVAEYAARGLGSLGMRNAGGSAELIHVTRALAREKRLRPVQFYFDAAAGRYGSRLRDEVLEGIVYPENHLPRPMSSPLNLDGLVEPAASRPTPEGGRPISRLLPPLPGDAAPVHPRVELVRRIGSEHLKEPGADWESLSLRGKAQQVSEDYRVAMLGLKGRTKRQQAFAAAAAPLVQRARGIEAERASLERRMRSNMISLDAARSRAADLAGKLEAVRGKLTKAGRRAGANS